MPPSANAEFATSVITAGEPENDRTTQIALSRLQLALSNDVPDLRSEVVHSDRHGLYSLDTDAVSSDVHRFTALCETAGRLPSVQTRRAYEPRARPGPGRRSAGPRVIAPNLHQKTLHI